MSDGLKKKYIWQNTNKLLWKNGYYGIKTGTIKIINK